MAEIKIRKKSPVWPWILLVLIILVALWYFFIYLDTTDVDDVDDVDDMNTEQVDNESYNSEDGMNNDTYSTTDSIYNATSSNNNLAATPVTTTVADANKSMIDLIDAVRTKSLETKVTINNDLKAQREKLVKTTTSTSENTWMKTLKESGDQIIAALQNIQKEKFPQLSNEVISAQNSLQMVDASKTFEDQKAEIDTFIRNVVTTLNKMQ